MTYPNRARENIILDRLKPKKNYAVIVMHPDGKTTRIVQEKAPDLEQLQKAVGGYVQEVPYFTKYATYTRGKCYADEEGKIKNKRFNKKATDLWYVQTKNMIPGDCLCGDVIFYATTTEECCALSENVQS